MHGMSLQLLADKLVPGAKCLDVGSGSGYVCAAMASMIFPKGNTSLKKNHYSFI